MDHAEVAESEVDAVLDETLRLADRAQVAGLLDIAVGLRAAVQAHEACMLQAEQRARSGWRRAPSSWT